jgi:hypothetical protein
MHTLRLLGFSPLLLCIAAAPPTDKSNGQQMVSAAQPVVPAASANPVPKADEPKICKPLAESGSRLPNRACLTKKEWDELKKEQDQY